MCFENKRFRKILFYLLFSIFVIWIIIDPAVPLRWRDGGLLILFMFLVHSLIDNKYLLHKVSKKYEAQSKMLSDIFRNCGNLIYRSDLYPSELDLKEESKSFNSSKSVSYRIAKKYLNGNVKVYDAYFAPIKDGSDKGGILGYVRDTTEVDILKEKILIQNAQLSSIINNMPFVIYLKDLQGRFIAGNKKLEELLNRKNDELVGFRPEDVYMQGYEGRIKEEDTRVINKRETVVVETLSSLFNKEGIWYRIIKSPIIGPNKKVLGIIVIINDINKEKELELQRDTFVATLTHDLKTPTRAQLTVMDILLSGSLGELNEEQRNMILQARNSNVYMTNMVSTILATYKSDASESTLQIEEFDFFETVNETCKELAALAETREQKIVLKSNAKNPFIAADKLQLKRAVTNLIANAIIHGFEKTDVFVEIHEKRKNLVFDVKNSSRYIEEERLAEIFEKYKSAKYAKCNKASTGLGLYLSRKIIRLHHGEIYANSWKNNTCIFGFSIPKNMPTKMKLAK